MSGLSKRSTVYLEPEIHQALKIKAAITHQSVSGYPSKATNGLTSNCVPP